MRHSRRRVLIVEDNYDSVITLITLIQGMGHDAQYALTGEAALDAARKFRPDIVLLDIGLPGIDGYQVARLLPAKTSATRCRSSR